MRRLWRMRCLIPLRAPAVAALGLREGRGVEDDEIEAVFVARRLRQVVERVGPRCLTRNTVSGHVLAGQFQGLPGDVDEPHAPCPAERRMNAEGPRVGEDVEDLGPPCLHKTP